MTTAVVINDQCYKSEDSYLIIRNLVIGEVLIIINSIFTFIFTVIIINFTFIAYVILWVILYSINT